VKFFDLVVREQVRDFLLVLVCCNIRTMSFDHKLKGEFNMAIRVVPSQRVGVQPHTELAKTGGDWRQVIHHTVLPKVISVGNCTSAEDCKNWVININSESENSEESSNTAPLISRNEIKLISCLILAVALSLLYLNSFAMGSENRKFKDNMLLANTMLIIIPAFFFFIFAIGCPHND